MKCTRCESLNKIKAGFVGGRQRYKCKDCGYFFSVEKKSDVKTPEQKRLALQMYLEGLGFRVIDLEKSSSVLFVANETQKLS